MALSNYLERKLLNHSLGHISYTAPEEVYIGLFTTLPDDTVAGVEPTGIGYSRQLVTWGNADDTGILNATSITFGTAGSAWGEVVGFGIWDLAAVGNLLWYGEINPTADMQAGDTYRFPANSIAITLD